MRNYKKETFLHILFTHFVPCFFLGVISLFLMQACTPDNIFQHIVDKHIDMMDVALASINGVFVGFVVWWYHRRHNKRVNEGMAWVNEPASPEKIRKAVLVGFCSGTFDILFGLHNFGIFVLTLFVLTILIWHLKMFAHNVFNMLKPARITTWAEVAELLRIYLNMLAGFTLVNAALEVAHILANAPSPFGFGLTGGQLFIDSLYYTVVSMTTLGFGDIVPHSWDAKLLLIFQCLISYGMFALIVGIITRGVVRDREHPERD